MEASPNGLAWIYMTGENNMMRNFWCILFCTPYCTNCLSCLISRFALLLGTLTLPSTHFIDEIQTLFFRESHIHICVALYLQAPNFQPPEPFYPVTFWVLPVHRWQLFPSPWQMMHNTAVTTNQIASPMAKWDDSGLDRPIPGFYCWCMVLAEKERWIQSARDKCYFETWILRVM